MRLEYYIPGMTPTPPLRLLPADRILHVLKTRGPLSTAELAVVLGVSGEATRQQMARLEADGLVRGERESGTVGRPRQRWSLTDRAQGRFPDTHPELAIHSSARSSGPSVRPRSTGSSGRGRRSSDGSTGKRWREPEACGSGCGGWGRSGRARDTWRRCGRITGDGCCVENHCPICAAARVCQGFCRSELALFREVLGPEVAVERVEHILAGARRCAYRIERVRKRKRATLR